MSTAQERAAARIAAIIAEGHSITLVRAAYRDGRDGVFTEFHVARPEPIDVRTAALAAEFQHGDAEDRAALKVELISRGWVQ